MLKKLEKQNFKLKKETWESITNGKSCKNTEIQEKVSNVTTSEDVARVVQEFEKIIKHKKSDIIWMTYHQGQLFQKLKKRTICKHGFTVWWQ